MNDLMNEVEVRRNNGECDYGPWMPATAASVPVWLSQLIAEAVIEEGQGSGKVAQGGSVWSWRKS